MKAKNVRTEGKKIVQIDGLEVVYQYELNYREFEKLTQAIALKIRLPFQMAVCKHPECISGIIIYGRYGSEWYTLSNYHDFLVQHLILKLSLK